MKRILYYSLVLLTAGNGMLHAQTGILVNVFYK